MHVKPRKSSIFKMIAATNKICPEVVCNDYMVSMVNLLTDHVQNSEKNVKFNLLANLVYFNKKIFTEEMFENCSNLIKVYLNLILGKYGGYFN